MDYVKRILYLMDINKVNAKELSDKTGISQSRISGWKTGKYLPSVEAVIKISLFFNISTDWLLLEGTMQSESMTPFPNTMPPLSSQQTELLKHFDKLNEEDKLKLIGRVEYMAEIQEQTNKKTMQKSSTYDNNDSEVTASFA